MKKTYNHMMLIILLIAGTNLVATIVNAGEAGNFPHSKMNCKDCHKQENPTDEQSKDASLINEDIVELCLKCHSEIRYAHHPQRVQVVDNAPEFLPLGAGNSITCLTCHDVHLKEKSAPRLLRSSEIGNYVSKTDLCYECHKNDFKKVSPHKSEKEGMTCLICHQDAPTIKDTRDSVTLVNKDIEKICNFCHMIDAEHPLNVDKTVKLADALPLSKDKKVICITCHDAHGTYNTINFLKEKYVSTLEFGKYDNPHSAKEYFNCMKCHADIPKVKDYVNCKYKDDFILLCYNCHGADGEKCHPINIKLKEGMTLPAGFELNDDEQITCVTCHNPDCSGGKKIRYKNLEKISSKDGICNDCHNFDDIKTINPHIGKEPSSKECFYCHKRDDDIKEFGMNEKFVCLKCHAYKEHPERKNQVSAGIVIMPKPGISLDKKSKIKCSTCHDPHEKNNENSKLKMVENMTICEACHQS